MYQVLCNGRPADCYNHDVHQSWNKSVYFTFEEAVEYAKDWLGHYGIGIVLKLNTPCDYGEGDIIEIREV